jgi:sulfate adenylyltransferase subunit 1
MMPFEPQQFKPHQDPSVLRFLTAGSVDDGKSTLIGRLLYDSKAILADQVRSIENAKHKRTEAGVLDLSLLTDGLEAEREQGITIDVAYRYFTTGTRKFIIADAPGHEQYTRNMVTAASTADAIVILIDPTRVQFDGEHAELLPQTRRHSAIAGLLGLQHIIVAVNKMDRMNFDAQVFERIRSAYLALAKNLSLPEPLFIPISALEGDNVVNASSRTPWYSGPTLLQLLESLPASGHVNTAKGMHTRQDPLNLPARLFVQRVQRIYGAETTQGSAVDGLRGLQGQLSSGRLKKGDILTVLPSGEQASVFEIRLGATVLEEAHAGQSITVLINENLDIARGDLLASSEDLPTVSKTILADMCWLDTAALNPAKRYWLKLGSRRVQAKILGVDFKLDLNSLSHQDAETPLTLNEIAQVRIAVAQPLPCTPFAQDSSLGRFILVDSGTHQTAAAGLVREAIV